MQTNEMDDLEDLKENRSLELLSKFTAEKNVDRVRFLPIKNEDNLVTLSALYELDKETKTKSGGLILHNINILTKAVKQIGGLSLPFGVLDYKVKQSNASDANLVFTANSNASFSIVKLEEFKLQVEASHQIFSKDSECTLNTLDISNVDYDSSILLAMNDGCHHIFDLTKGGIEQTIQSHEYGLWSCLCIDNNIYATGSEDSLLKLWDRRTNNNKPLSSNKSHSASINCIYQDNLIDTSGNVLVTGSYDEHFTAIDLRQFNTHLCRQKLNCSIWDINQQTSRDKKLLIMSCVYEGFNIFEYKQGEDYSLSSFLSSPVGGKSKTGEVLHNSIVYGLDSVKLEDKVFTASSSFYDNTILIYTI